MSDSEPCKLYTFNPFKVPCTRSVSVILGMIPGRDNARPGAPHATGHATGAVCMAV